MNNILLGGGISDLENYSNHSTIVVDGNNTLNVINLKDDVILNIKLNANACLNLNMFDFSFEKKIEITVEEDDYSTFNLNAAFINDGKYSLNIHNNLYGNNINSNVNIRGINERDGVVTILMDGTVAGETKDNVLNEYAKIINRSDASNVMIPNLIVNTNEVTVNHGVSIGNISEDELFYLATKGINKYTAQKLVEEGFILSIMDERIKERIKNMLIGR